MGLYRRIDKGRRGDVWWISYFKSGRQYRESSGSTNKRAAAQILAVRKAELVEERWRLPRSKSPHLGPWMKEFLTSVGHAKTRSRYQSSTNNLIAYFGEKVRLSEIAPEAIFRFQQKRLSTGASKATVNRDIATLSSSFTRAKRMRLVSHNPCSDIGKLNERKDRRIANPLSYDEEDRIKNFSYPLLHTLITVLVDTGLRVQKEALPLRWDNVSLDSDPAWIRVVDSKSSAGLRTVWLTENCRLELKNWKELTGSGFSQFVFPSPRNPKAHFCDYKTAWRTAARKAGLADRRIYDLRATFASRANSCRATQLTVAQLLGHSRTDILPTYVRPLDENTRAVIAAMNEERNLHKSSGVVRVQ